MSRNMKDCRAIKAEMHAVIRDEHLRPSEIKARILALAEQVPGISVERFADQVDKLSRADNEARAHKLVDVLDDFVPKPWVVRTAIVTAFAVKWSLILSAIGLVVWLVTR